MATRGDPQRCRPTSSMATSSQRMALSANKNKNWRANYLRALNIFTPDLATPSRPRHADTSKHQQTGGRSETSSRRRAAAASAASTVEEPTRRTTSSTNSRDRASVTSARHSSRSSSSTRSKRGTSPADEKAGTYVFGLRSHLFRARRLATKSDTMVVDRVSAPIEIPTGSSMTSPTAIPSRGDKLSDRRDSESHRRRGRSNDFQNSTDKQPMVQLLSWEEPSVMLGSGGWPLESDKRDSVGSGMDMPLSRHDSGRFRRSSRPYSGPDGIAEECEDTEDEDADRLTNTEDDDDVDIFKMEFDGDSDASNVFRGKRPSKDQQRRELQQRRPGGLYDFDDDEEDDVIQPLSASFVPPHQMVERGCFSYGLRDELKRKPGVHI